MENIDPATIGVPNICFSLLSKTDPRFIESKKDRIERGFDDSETWSLTDTIANFCLPRLKRYNEIAANVIVQSKEEKEGVAALIDMFELVARDNGAHTFTDDESKRVQAGLDAFPKTFMLLWW